MDHSKHKKFKLLSHGENYSLIEDIKTGEEHKCFKLTTHFLGDEFYLYIKDLNIFSGRYSFAYSVLNDYKKGSVYRFDILEEQENFAIISNHPNLRMALPLSLLQDRDNNKIELVIDTIDPSKNKLFFRNKNYDEINTTDFNENKIYELEVIDDYFNHNNTRFAIIKYRDKKFRTNLPFALNKIDLDETMPFYLDYYKDGNTPTLNVSREYVTKKLYNKGEKYLFEIAEIDYNSETGTTIWNMVDQYGMYNRYYPDSDISIDKRLNKYQIGDKIELYIKNFILPRLLRPVSSFS